MKLYWGNDNENLEGKEDKFAKGINYRQWQTSTELMEGRRDSFDGFNFDYELNRFF